MERSTTGKGQRIAIWVIIVAMTVGSIGAYFMIILQNDNEKIDQENQLALQKQLQEEAQKANQPLDGHKAEPFDEAEVDKLVVEEITPGKGKAATKDSTVTANYFGWTSDGKIFDSSKKSGETKPVEFSLKSVIPGWTEGLTGVKEGAVVKLIIPTNKAYGAQTPPGDPAGPLTFIIELKKVQ